MLTVLIVLLILGVVGVLPGVRGTSYGYAPMGLGTILLIVLIVMLLTGHTF